jgi:hypothetical protein
MDRGLAFSQIRRRGAWMPIQNSKWHAYVADIDIMARRADSPFGLTFDDLSVIEFGFDCDMPASAFASLLRDPGRTRIAGLLPGGSKQRAYA